MKNWPTLFIVSRVNFKFEETVIIRGNVMIYAVIIYWNSEIYVKFLDRIIFLHRWSMTESIVIQRLKEEKRKLL